MSVKIWQRCPSTIREREINGVEEMVTGVAGGSGALVVV
jgi:hypothetical protein